VTGFKLFTASTYWLVAKIKENLYIEFAWEKTVQIHPLFSRTLDMLCLDKTNWVRSISGHLHITYYKVRARIRPGGFG
jgi:hypothetical protein